MVWRLPKGSKQLAADGQSQWKNPPSEEELRNTLTAQYRSTYRTDFLGVPQGKAITKNATIWSITIMNRIENSEYQNCKMLNKKIVLMSNIFPNSLLLKMLSFDSLGTFLTGYHRNQTILAPLSCKQQAPYSIQTEMRHNYQEPRQKSALQGNMSRYGCNALHEVAPKGIGNTRITVKITSQLCN